MKTLLIAVGGAMLGFSIVSVMMMAQNGVC
jgi:hypothetical protein